MSETEISPTGETLKTDDMEKLQKEVWEKAIDTQMHFNEMSVRSRQLGLSFVVASLGVVVVLLTKDDARLSLHFFSIHVAGLILFFAAFGLQAVALLDLGVYHKMLRGAVAFNEAFEERTIRPAIMKTSLGLTQAISLYSRYPDSRDLKEQGSKETAEQRVRKFYRYSQISLIAIGLILTAVTLRNVTPAGQSMQPAENQKRSDPTPPVATPKVPSVSPVGDAGTKN